MSIQESSTQNTTSPPGAVERVTEVASTTMSSATEGTKRVADEAAHQTKTVAHEAKAQAQQLMNDTKAEIHQQADARAHQASEGLRTFSSSITALLEGRPDEAEQLRAYLEQAKSKVDAIAARVETRGPQGLVDDLSTFARRRPGAFLVAAGAAGFAAGRLARAGAATASDEQSAQQFSSGNGSSQFSSGNGSSQFSTAPAFSTPGTSQVGGEPSPWSQGTDNG